MRYYERIEKTSENRLPQRACYIPKGAARQILLNGVWDFAFFENGDLAGEPERWNSITVPSCWQCRGYEAPNYTSVAYPFTVDPPYVPAVNPMGVYEREFSLSDTELRTYLVLEGVSSCAEILVNGAYVGFTQGSHLQAEFDLTDFVRPGRNRIRIRVRKWCVGSYLEDQDMLRFHGIFRDVYLLQRPEGHLRDFELFTEKNRLTLRTDRPARVVLSRKGVTLFDTQCESLLERTVPDAVFWNAEQPELYDLQLFCAGEIISQRFGFRDIRISERKELLINETPVKLRGVNHHDTTPTQGWAITNEEIERDLRLMKKLHINTIRTSHYPPVPYLLELANELGFYVILETDVETHGFVMRNPDLYRFDTSEPIWPCSGPEWKTELLERMARALERDKNQSCIIMWSVGNENGYGQNLEASLEYLHQRDPRRLAHYEDASRENRPTCADVYARMYPSMEQLDRMAEDPDIRVPIILSEYAHAKGNGPGDVWQYWEKFYARPNLIGGCIWEWADHGVWDGKAYRYGGDFPGELTHSGCSCCDGMLFGDRSLKAGALEVAAAYAPMRMEIENGVLRVTNRFDFTDYRDHTLEYELSADGACLLSETVRIPLAPGQSWQKDLSEAVPAQCRMGCFVRVRLLDADGTVQADQQQELPVPRVQAQPCSVLLPEEDASFYYFRGEGFSYRFSKQLGAFDSLTVDGRELLDRPMQLTAFRPYTDNEPDMRKKWYWINSNNGENLDRQFCNVHELSCTGGRLRTRFVLGGVGRRPYLTGTQDVFVDADGQIHVELDADIAENAVWLPRLGYELHLKKDNVPFRYFAMGPDESYEDCCHHGAVDFYDSTAAAEYVPYARPQEHGNHVMARYLELDGCWQVCAEQFQFCVSQYEMHEIDAAQHWDELPVPHGSHVRIDYRDSGLGSHSCGPDLAEQFRVAEKKIRFAFAMGRIVPAAHAKS